MKRALFTSVAVASAIMSVAPSFAVSVPSGFCKGVRETGEEYGKWIDEHALSTHDALNVTDPTQRDILRSERAKVWKDAVRAGQLSLCGKATF